MSRRPYVFMWTKNIVNVCFRSCEANSITFRQIWRRKIPLLHHFALIRHTMHRRNAIKGPWIYAIWIMHEWIVRSCACVCVHTCLLGVFNTWNHSFRTDVAGCWLRAGPVHPHIAGSMGIHPYSVGQITWKRFHHLIILVLFERMGEWANKCAHLSESSPLTGKVMKWCWVYNFFVISRPMLTQLGRLYKQTIINPQPSACKNPSWNILNHWFRMGISGNDCVLSHKRAFEIKERSSKTLRARGCTTRWKQNTKMRRRFKEYKLFWGFSITIFAPYLTAFNCFLCHNSTWK